MKNTAYKYLSDADIEDGKTFLKMYSELSSMGKKLTNAFIQGLVQGEANIKDAEKAGQEVRKLIYVSERILNIQDLEKEIKNAALHFDILKKELKKTASSSDVVDAAVYQISQSLEKANDFEFCLEQRKCEIKDAYENPRFAGNHQDAGNAD